MICNCRGCQDVMVQNVTIHPGPTVNAGADVDFCDGEGGAQINATASGGTGTYFYSWWCEDPTGAACGLSSNVIEDPIANPLVTPFAPDSMTYYFQMTDINGCMSNIDSVLVIVKPKPLMDAGPDVAICAEGPGAFLTGGLATNNQAPLPISYQWSPSNGLNDANVPNPFARPDTTTIYTLQGTSVNGCSSAVTTLDTLSTVTVIVDDLPIADAGRDTAICLLDFVQLQGSASNSGPNYTYTWTPAIAGTIDDPNIPSPTVTPGFSTTYYLVVSARGCDSHADSVTVSVDNQPTLSPGIDESVCQGDSVRLDGNATGDPGGNLYTYQWSPSASLNDPTLAKPLAAPKQTTTYTLIATSENGACDSDPEQITVTVESTPVVFALSKDTVICEGEEIQLAADHGFKTPVSNPVSYAWTPNDASILTSPFLPSVNVQPTTTTLYTVTASAPSGCATSVDILLSVNPKIEALVSADTSRFCEGTSTQLHVSGGLGNATFQWIPATGLDDPFSTDPIASPSSTTTYQVIVSEGVCVDSAEVSVTINPAPIADYFASQNTGCEGLEVSFMDNSTNGINYQWDFGDGSQVNNEANPTHVFPDAGQYLVSLKVIGAGGCEAVISKTIVEVALSGSADFSSIPDINEIVALPNAAIQFTDLSTNGVSWYWNFGDGKISTEQNPIHVFTNAGEYAVSLSVTDQNGCISFIQYGPYIVATPDLEIPNLLTPNDDGINDIFRVQYTGNESFNLTVFDRWGRSFYSSDSPQDAWEGNDPNGGKAVEGVYFYSLKLGDKIYRGNISLLR
ncbi:MAG: PKD domain-containing protein [Bacteroidia bacterium]